MIRFIASLLNRLTAPTAVRLGAAIGLLAFHCHLRRRVVREQLRDQLGLSGPRRRQVARQAYLTTFGNFLEVWTTGGPDGLEHHTRVLNPGWLRHLHARHQGLVIVTGHLGNWEGAALATKPHVGRTLVYAKAQDARTDGLLNERRTATGVEVLLAHRGDHTAAVQVVRALRSGGTVGLLADQRPRVQEAVAAPFLGRPAWCHPGPVFFARKLGLPVIPGFCVRRSASESVVFFGRPVDVSTGEESAAHVRTMGLISAFITAFPGQYFWMHHRFRKTPPTAPADDGAWRRGLRHLAGLAVLLSPWAS